MSGMAQWWEDRPVRERAMLMILSGIVVAFGLFQFGFKPLLFYRAAAQANYADAAEVLTDVESAAREIQALQSSITVRANAVPRTVISATASELGLSITRLQPQDKAGLDVWLNGVVPTTLFKWVAVLYERHGISVARASVQRSGEGETVNAQISFAVGAEE